MASGSVASWEVVWRETDRGTESSSGSLTGTSYTIDQLESTTIYTVTVKASNVAGTTDSQPITFSTGTNSNERSVELLLLLFITASDVCQAESVASSCECDNTAAIIGGVVAVTVVFMVTTAVTIIVIVVFRSRKENYSKLR